jgi:hypothetical protein
VLGDGAGEVYGHPSVVEAGLVAKDGAHILVEVKPKASRAGFAELWRVGKLYEKAVGSRPRLVLISPFIRERALEPARSLGAEVYTELGWSKCFVEALPSASSTLSRRRNYSLISTHL